MTYRANNRDHTDGATQARDRHPPRRQPRGLTNKRGAAEPPPRADPAATTDHASAHAGSDGLARTVPKLSDFRAVGSATCWAAARTTIHWLSARFYQNVTPKRLKANRSHRACSGARGRRRAQDRHGSTPPPGRGGPPRPSIAADRSAPGLSFYCDPPSRSGSWTRCRNLAAALRRNARDTTRVLPPARHHKPVNQTLRHFHVALSQGDTPFTYSAALMSVSRLK
jgi:hypothetical protein